MSLCRECNTPIRWVVTENGKKMSLDINRYTGGNPQSLFIIRRGVAIAVTPASFPGEPIYQAHLATCRK